MPLSRSATSPAFAFDALTYGRYRSCQKGDVVEHHVTMTAFSTGAQPPDTMMWALTRVNPIPIYEMYSKNITALCLLQRMLQALIKAFSHHSRQVAKSCLAIINAILMTIHCLSKAARASHQCDMQEAARHNRGLLVTANYKSQTPQGGQQHVCDGSETAMYKVLSLEL